MNNLQTPSNYIHKHTQVYIYIYINSNSKTIHGRGIKSKAFGKFNFKSEHNIIIIVT